MLSAFSTYHEPCSHLLIGCRGLDSLEPDHAHSGEISCAPSGFEDLARAGVWRLAELYTTSNVQRTGNILLFYLDCLCLDNVYLSRLSSESIGNLHSDCLGWEKMQFLEEEKKMNSGNPVRYVEINNSVWTLSCWVGRHRLWRLKVGYGWRLRMGKR